MHNYQLRPVMEKNQSVYYVTFNMVTRIILSAANEGWGKS